MIVTGKFTTFGVSVLFAKFNVFIVHTMRVSPFRRDGHIMIQFDCLLE